MLTKNDLIEVLREIYPTWKNEPRFELNLCLDNVIKYSKPSDIDVALDQLLMEIFDEWDVANLGDFMYIFENVRVSA